MAEKGLRSGYTTGSCAAAAAQAAVLAYQGKTIATVELLSPQGEKILVPIQKVFRTSGGAKAIVIKDSGDDPDITNGMEVIVECIPDPGLKDIEICGGEGIGIVTKPGLSVNVGTAAINPVPRRMIRQAVQHVWNEEFGCKIVVSIPNGRELAKKTLNPILGIEGGLSVIGTSGIVRPMSEEAFKHSLSPQISIIKALGYQSLVLVPGKIGYDVGHEKFALPRECIAQMSNFTGYMLESAVKENIKKVLLLGHLGKLVKIAAGIFHTHNRIADARMETLAAYLGANGAPQKLLQEILQCTTTEAAMPLISNYKMDFIYRCLAERASNRAMRYVFGELQIGTVIVTLQGKLLGMDENAAKIGAELGWNIKS